MILPEESHASALPEGILPCDKAGPDGVVHSLTAHALAEMERHKWIESERSCHDVGPRVYHAWLRTCWNGWIRSKMLEHLYGWRRWSAFDPEHFGLFRRRTVERSVPTELVRQIAGILQAGGENLDVVSWAQDAGADLESVLWLLERIDINAVRNRLLTDHILLFLPQESGSAEAS